MCMQVRFDLPSTMLAFVQSSGRARMPDSHMVLMVEDGNEEHSSMLINVRRCEHHSSSGCSHGIFLSTVSIAAAILNRTVGRWLLSARAVNQTIQRVLSLSFFVLCGLARCLAGSAPLAFAVVVSTAKVVPSSCAASWCHTSQTAESCVLIACKILSAQMPRAAVNSSCWCRRLV